MGLGSPQGGSKRNPGPQRCSPPHVPKCIWKENTEGGDSAGGDKCDPEAQEVLPYSVLLPERELKAVPSPALPKLVETTLKSLHQDNCTGLLPTFLTTILHQGKKRTSTHKSKAGARRLYARHRRCKLLTSAVGGRTQGGGQSPETRTLGEGPVQSVVDLRYQNRARKSSLHVMKPGLVGEWTMQRTMLLWPRDSRFLRSAVLESQQHRLMVLSSGSKI